jgi:hypothetical protein
VCSGHLRAGAQATVQGSGRAPAAASLCFCVSVLSPSLSLACPGSSAVPRQGAVGTALPPGDRLSSCTSVSPRRPIHVLLPFPCTPNTPNAKPLSLGSPALLPPLALHSMLPAHVASQHSAPTRPLVHPSTHLVPSTLATLAPWRDVTTCSAQCLAASECPPRRPTPHCRLLLAAPSIANPLPAS